jgi:rubrerythrin
MSALPAFLDEPLQRLFLRELLATPRGQATLLRQLADAEGGDGGELDIFEHMLEVIDDDEVKKLVRVHKEDEERHERIFLARAARTGAQPIALPKSSQILRRLDHHVGFFSRPVTDRAGVVEAYLLLLVIEERAMKQFSKWREAFLAIGDEESAVVLEAVEKDEERHLRYCEAITRRYSDDEAERQRKIAHYRALEQRCFEEVQAVNVRAMVDGGLVGHRWWTRRLWRALSRAAQARIPDDLRAELDRAPGLAA